MAKLRNLGRPDGFERHWPYVDTHRWPGREFKFLYCHPIIAAILIFTVIAEIIIFVWIRKVPFS